jgi:hypothetical protein
MPTTPLEEARTPAPQGAGWLALGLVAFALYAFAALVPRGDTWGFHALAYLPAWMRLLALSVSFGLLLPPVQRRAAAVLERLMRPLLSTAPLGQVALAAFTALAFVLFYRFAIRTEVYGDTRTIIRHWNENAAVSSTWIASLLDVRLQHNDAALTELFLRTVSNTFALPIVETFRITSAAAGALSLCLWIVFVRSEFAGSRWSALLVLAACTLGATQIFFGHVETYGFVFLTMVMLLLTAYLCLEGKASAWLVGLLFLVALKAHASAICFAPALLFLFASRLAPRFPALGRVARRRGVLVFLVLPALALGAGLYAFHFHALAAPYRGATGGLPPMFLPLLPSPGPWDYTLLSPAHLVDLGNVLLLVGMPVLIVLAGLVLLHRRAIDWQHPTVVFAGVALLFHLLFFCAVNPLLSLPRDWDLFALAGAPLLFFLAAVLAHCDEDAVPFAAPFGAGAAFCVFTAAFWVLNVSPDRLSPRLEQVGEHVFRTYHTSGSYLLGTAQGMDPDTTRSIRRRLATIERLTLVPGDEESTHLLMMLAATYRAREDRANAVRWVDRAAANVPGDRNVALFRADYLLWADRPQDAVRGLDDILASDPGNFDALVLAAGAAADEAQYDRALAFLARAAAVRPADPDVATWAANVRARKSRGTPKT